MEQLFNWPVASVAVGLAVGLALTLGGFALLAWRARILARLGLRNIPRRPTRAALIVFGLTLSTTVIGSAFGTGDTITYTLRSLVAKSLGTVDEVVVQNTPRASNSERARGLLDGSFGGLKANELGFFPLERSDQIAAATRGSRAIAAVEPAIADQVTVIHGDTQQLQTAVATLAIRTPAPAFGPLQTTEGTPVELEALAADEIVLNAAAAGAFGADAGSELQILTGGSRPDSPRWTVRVAAVTENGGISGVQPLVIVPLARYQEVIGRADRINQILVVNRGGLASVTRTEAANSELRALLVNPAQARQLRDYLSRPDVQRALLQAEAEGTFTGRDRERLAALRAEATKPEMTDRFTSLVSEPRTRRQLFGLARNIANRNDRNTVLGALQNLTPLSVVGVKQEGYDQAAEWGTVVTTVFLTLGIFSIAASVLLIGLIFTLLAADRGAELATMRALGMRRRQIIAMFLLEGLVYNLLGAGLGALCGYYATGLTVTSLANALAGFGFVIERHVEPRSLFVAFAGGVLLTFATMFVAAWRVSRMQIVAGSRGEAVSESHAAPFVLGLLLTLAAGAIWWRWREPPLLPLPRPPLILPGVLSLALLGVACCLLSWPRLHHTAPGARLASALATGTGLALGLIWLRALTALPTPRGELTGDALVAATGGLVLIFAAVWTATRALGPLLKGLDRGLAGAGRLRAIVRPAAAALGGQRWRVGLTVVMFGVVIFIMVVALTMIDVLVNAYARDEAPVAGYELRADLRGSAGGQPLDDIEAALAEAPAVSRDLFGAIGGMTIQDVQVVQLGAARSSWRGATLAAVDDGFLDGIAVRIARRAPGYDSDRAVWRALREQPGAAVVTASMGQSALSIATPTEGDVLAPFTVWARPPDGGRPVKLTVIGVIDARTELNGGIYTSRATAAGMGAPAAAPTTYFFAVQPGVRLRDAAEGLRISFADRGLVVTDLGDELRIGRSVRALLTQVVQGFMGLGLIAGIAALGILGVQSVIERRQELGTLRALGFTRWQTRLTLAFESAVIAALGIALGTALGLLLARVLVALLAADHPEIRYAVPWGQISITATLAWLGALGALSLAAWQAGRVSPADALRVA